MKKNIILSLIFVLLGATYVQANSVPAQKAMYNNSAVVQLPAADGGDETTESTECELTVSAEVDLGLVTTTVSVTVRGDCDTIAEKAAKALQAAIEEVKKTMNDSIVAW